MTNNCNEKKDRSLVRDIIIFFAGTLLSIIITVTFSFDNGIKDWLIRLFNCQYDIIHDVEFESIYSSNMKSKISINWKKPEKATKFKIFRKKLDIDYNINNKDSRYLMFKYLKETYSNDFLDSCPLTGPYVYKIQAYEGSKLIDEKDFLWYHRFKVKIANNGVNVRNFNDWCFEQNSIFFTATISKNMYGYTSAGPINVICPYDQYKYGWWNVTWSNGLSGWSVDCSQKEGVLLDFQNVRGEPIKLDFINNVIF